MVSYVYQKITESYDQQAAYHGAKGNPPTVAHDSPMRDENNASEKAKGGENQRTDSNQPRIPFSWKEDIWKNKHVRGWTMAGATIGAMIFTGWLVCQNGSLVDSAYNTLRHQITVDSIRTGSDSVRAIADHKRDSILIYNSQRTVEIGDSSMRINSRAFLMFSGAKFDTLAGGQRAQITTQIENAGKTPAYHLWFWAYADTSLREYSKRMKEGRDTIPANNVSLGSGITISLIIGIKGMTGQWTQRGVDMIKSGKMKVFIYGIITYKDAFGEGHFTKFCFYNIGDFYTFTPWSKYNDAN